MEWTTQKPTEPGWYWYWYWRFAGAIPCIVEIVWADKEGGPLAIWDDESGPDNLDSVQGWFMGPLERPEPPVRGE